MNRTFSTKANLSKLLIWVYNINDYSLVNGAPFKTKTECAKVLNVNRATVGNYLDTQKVYNDKWIISSKILNKNELSYIWSISSKLIEIITGELLGDGHITFRVKKDLRVSGRLEFTFSVKNLPYLKYLKFKSLAYICTDSPPTPWPNPLFGKKPTQYWFSSKSYYFLGELHSFWYKKIEGKWIKILPLDIEKRLTPVSIAHWIMGDGYFSSNSTIICTDNFTQEEVLLLKDILSKKFGLMSVLIKRINPNGNIVWRIKINKLSMEKLKMLIFPYLITEMYYKLGMK
jgi:LAGLIDADG DNA endonuclease family